MWGVEAAVIATTIVFTVIALLTSPWWMKGLAQLLGWIWRQLGQAEREVDIVENEIPKEEK